MNQDTPQAIRIFIGTSPNGEDAEAEMVLEYTLRKHSSQPLDITWMRQSKDSRSIWHCGWRGWNSRSWATPFTGFRWAIPEACNFEGKAIYMDADMVNLHDISQLFNVDFSSDKAIKARTGHRWDYEFCVMLMDCAKLKSVIPPLKALRKLNGNFRSVHERLLKADMIESLDPRWNCLDGEDLAVEDIWHLHFTKMASQPWKPSWFTGITEAHSRPEIADLWFKYKAEAIANAWWPKKPNPPFGKFNIRRSKKKPIKT